MEKMQFTISRKDDTLNECVSYYPDTFVSLHMEFNMSKSIDSMIGYYDSIKCSVTL